jgi:hypothetical protein
MNAKPRLVCAALVVALAALPAAAGDRIEKSLKLAPGGRLYVEADSGQVAVTGSADGGATVVVTSKTQDLEERWALAFEETPGQLRVTSKRKGPGGGTLLGWLTGSASNNAPKFEIRVPRETQVSVRTAGGAIHLASLEGAATLETAGGSIKILEVTGDTTASTAGGSIDVSKLVGDLSAETAGGSVRVSGVTGNARVETAGGSISLEGVGGHVQAATAGGSIDAGLESANSLGGRLKTSGGSIRLRIDPAANLLLQASSSGGTVSNEVPMASVTRKTRTVLEGTLGKGGAELVLESRGGSVRIEPLEAPR